MSRFTSPDPDPAVPEPDGAAPSPGDDSPTTEFAAVPAADAVPEHVADTEPDPVAGAPESEFAFDSAWAELRYRFPLTRVTLWFSVVLCAVLFGYGAWQRRWIADDGLIVLRTVRNLLAGNGPVFNAGERVEVNTSTAWTYLLWFFSWISDVQTEYVVLWVALVLSVAAIPLAMLGTARLYKGGSGWDRMRGTGVLLLPAGGLVYIALPPAREFATSGLEVSLTIFWIALLWWLSIAWAQAPLRPARGRLTVLHSWAVLLGLAFVAGMTWLVRPELAVLGGLILLVMVFAPIGTARRLAVIAVAGFLPVVYQIFRMGYYGLPVPNTAVAKDASGSKWHQGFIYLANLMGPYALWLPLLVLAIGVPLILLSVIGARRPAPSGAQPRRRRREANLEHGRLERWRTLLHSPTVIVVVTLIGGVLETMYWLRQGGDFMSGRVLLAPLFILLLPVMVLPLRIPGREPEGAPDLARAGRLAATARLTGGAVGAAIAAVCWVVVIGWAMYVSTMRGMPNGTSIGPTGIVDERAFYALQIGNPHPLTAADYLDYPRMRSLQDALLNTPRGGLYLPSYDYDYWFVDPLPYPRPPGMDAKQTVFFTNLGMTSMNTSLNTRIWDQVGLAWPIATHTSRLTDGRIGHDKDQFPDWAVAESHAFPKKPALPPFIDPDWVNQADKALQCPAIQELQASYRAPLTFHLFIRNIKLSLANMEFRIDRVPENTLRMCRMDVPPPLTDAQKYMQPK